MGGEKVCFVLAPIGAEGTDIRRRSNTVFEDVIQEVVSDFGYECKRADHIEEPGVITNQVIEYIVESELVVADLTGKNPNVFYELAVRHTHQKPVIQLINKDEDIPFDVATQRTINIDLDDFSTTKAAQEKIRGQLEEIEEDDFEVENPVSVADYIRGLKESGEPEKQQLAELTELLNDINSKVHSLENEIADPENILPPEYFYSIQNQAERESSEKQLQELNIIEKELNALREKLEGTVEAEQIETMQKLLHRVSRLRNQISRNRPNLADFD